LKKLVNLIRGYVEWQITGAYPERMINQCAREQIRFWHLQRLDETAFVFCTSLSDSSKVAALAAQVACEAKVLTRRGLGAAVLTMRKRWGFLMGLALCLAAVGILSRFVLVVDVTGNETVPDAVILTQLQQLGLKPGTYGPSVDRKELSNRALLALSELSYMSINIYGTRAEVLVHEKSAHPDLLEETKPADVVSTADGILVELRADAGQPLFKVGDVVARGEILISGVLDLQEPVGGKVDLGYLVVRAAGSVRARTWRTLEESIPLVTGGKSYTGQEKERYALQILWGSLDFFENSSISYGRYDKITCTRMLTVAGRELPFGLTTTTYREYTVEQAPLDVERAEERLKQMLLKRLDDLMDANDGIVLRRDMVTRMTDGMLIVTLLAECEEEIGRTVEREGETGRIPGGIK